MNQQELTLPRNPILIKLFRVLKLAENAGYGFDKMFNGWKAHYKVEPVVENEITFYKIEFPLPQKIEITPQKILTKLETSILKVIQTNPIFSREEIVRKLNISPETVKEYLVKLKDKGVLKRIGPDKGGHWEVRK